MAAVVAAVAAAAAVEAAATAADAARGGRDAVAMAVNKANFYGRVKQDYL